MAATISASELPSSLRSAARELARGARFDAVHVNAEFAETDERASDHDPLLASFRLRLDDGDWLVA